MHKTCCLVFCLYALLCEAASLAAMRVEEVNGTVYGWEPFNNQWQTYEVGDSIQPDTLLHIRDDSNILISFANYEKIQLRRPMVIRVSQESLRLLKKDQIYLDSLDLTLALKEQAGEARPELNVNDAFQRDVAVVDRIAPLEKLKNLYERITKQDWEFEQAQAVEEIEVLAPGDNLIFSSQDFPVILSLIWRHKKNFPEKLELYRWSKNKKIPDLPTTLLDSKEGNKALSFNRRGNYRLLLKSADGKFQSRVVKVRVRRPRDLTIAQKQKAIDKGAMITLDFPVNRFNLVQEDSNDSKIVEFSWTTKKASFSAWELVIQRVLPDKGQKKVLSTSVPRYRLKLLKPGTYLWYIQQKGGLGYKSRVRELTVSPQLNLARFLKEGHGGRLWMDRIPTD